MKKSKDCEDDDKFDELIARIRDMDQKLDHIIKRLPRNGHIPNSI